MPLGNEWASTILDGTPNADVANRVMRGVEQLFEVDGDLLRRRANERAITALFACHLKPLFADWNVDCEFNRDYKSAKDIKTIGLKRVVPDVIVHHRLNLNANAQLDPAHHLLAIEVKQSSRENLNSKSDLADLEKLAGFRRVHGYQYALFLKLVAGKPKLGLWRATWV